MQSGVYSISQGTLFNGVGLICMPEKSGVTVSAADIKPGDKGVSICANECCEDKRTVLKSVSSSIMEPLLEKAMPASIRLVLISILMPLLAAGCASLSPGFEEPLIEVTSIRLQNSGGLSPEFDIALRVSNPNRDALNIDGMTYTLYLAGKKVVSGVSNDTPSIPGYGEGEVKLRVGLSLFGGISFLNDLMTEHPESVDYELVTKLDVGRFYSKITIKQQGLFTF